MCVRNYVWAQNFEKNISFLFSRATCVASPSFLRRTAKTDLEKKREKISPIYFTFMWENTRAYAQISSLFPCGSRKVRSKPQLVAVFFCLKLTVSSEKIIGFHCENWRGMPEQVFSPIFLHKKKLFFLSHVTSRPSITPSSFC